MVTAQSGSPTDLRNAIIAALASGDDDVFIPNGEFPFNVDAGPVIMNVPAYDFNIIGAGIGQTILHLPNAMSSSPSNVVMLAPYGMSGKRVDVSGITFRGRSNNDSYGRGDAGIVPMNCRDFRVHHCRFDGKLGGQGVTPLATDNPAYGCRGVVDHCEFADIFVEKAFNGSTGGTGYGHGYGVMPRYYLGSKSYWYPDYQAVAGHYDDLPFVIYIEDNDFSGCRHAVTGNEGSMFVFRHNKVHDMSHFMSGQTVDQHPYRDYGDGGRFCEVYENNLIDGALYCGSGAAYWYKNVIGTAWWNQYVIEQGQSSLSPQYPKCIVDAVWIWGNDLSGQPARYYISNNGRPAPVIHEYAPTGYVAYPYPHPLTLGETPSILSIDSIPVRGARFTLDNL